MMSAPSGKPVDYIKIAAPSSANQTGLFEYSPPTQPGHDAEHLSSTSPAEEPRDDSQSGTVSVYRVTTATLGKNHFMNAVELKLDAPDKQQPPGFTPVFYTLRDDGRSLTIYQIDRDRAVAAVRSGAIAGSIEQHEVKDDSGKTSEQIDAVRITAEPQALDAFMAKPEAADLFRVYMVFRKAE